MHLRLQAKSADSFEDREQKFIWKPYIPCGEFTGLIASGGTGKTALSCLIAADISQGRRLFNDENHETPTPANVMMISAEDSGEILKQRLKRCDADLSRIYIMDCTDSIGLDLDAGRDAFIEFAKQFQPKLIVLDPWYCFAGRELDLSKLNLVRQFNQGIAKIAKSLDCGILEITHKNKKSQLDDVNNGAIGSVDFINSARSAITLIRDDIDKDTRILVHSKSNHSAAGKSLKYCFTKDGAIKWAGVSSITADTLLDAARFKKKPGELLREQEDEQESLDGLLDFFAEVAVPGKAKLVTYEDVKNACGNVFAGMQPKRFMDSHAAEFSEYGYSILTGKNIRIGNTSKTGFSLFLSEEGNAEKPELEYENL